MKKFIIQSIALLTVFFAAMLIGFSKVDVPFIPQTLKSNVLLVNNVQLDVEIADTQSKRSVGLGGRQSLASDSGMLFEFSESKKYQFWMKGMKFPIDFIWIRQKKVVDILKNISPPQPGQKDETLPIYVPITEIDSVLEVNAGFVDGHNIKVGDQIQLK